MAVCLLRVVKQLSKLSPVRINSALISINQRSIMTTRPRLDKAMEELQKNPYFNKYAQKIAKMQETNPEEFLQRIESKEEKLKKKKESQQGAQGSYQSQAKPHLEPGAHKRDVQLNKIMKVDMIQDKTKEEIIEIWNQYHKHKDCICGTLTPEQYEKMFDRGKKHSTFLLPLPRDQGYEFIVIQFSGPEVHMTPLLWYQTHKENAPECLTMTYYTELKDSKAVVLMRGEFDNKYMNAQEAQCIANELQLYYSNDHPERLKLLEIFTNKPDEFKHMDLIKQLETISFDLPKDK